MDKLDFEAGSKIAQAIDKYVVNVAKQTFESVPNNKTKYGKVVSSVAGVFVVEIDRAIYTNVLALRNVGTIYNGEIVICLIPNNQFSNIIIIGVADGSLLAGGGTGGPINIGNVITNTISSDKNADVKVSNRYDEEKEITYTDFEFDIPQGKQGIQGETGPQGETGNGISNIVKTSTVGLVDTYTINYTNKNTDTFYITNGRGISNIVKTSTVGLVDTYTINYNDNTTSTYMVTNGKIGEQGPQGEKGDTGATPNITTTAITLPEGSQATATISGTAENPLITFGIPKGEHGDSGILYDTTGQNTDGAMTQKATTDALNQFVTIYDWNTKSGTFTTAEGALLFSNSNAYILAKQPTDEGHSQHLFCLVGISANVRYYLCESSAGSSFNNISNACYKVTWNMLGNTYSWTLEENSLYDVFVPLNRKIADYPLSSDISTADLISKLLTGEINFGDKIVDKELVDGYGYIRYASGLLLQWGGNAVNANTSVVVNFFRPFAATWAYRVFVQDTSHWHANDWQGLQKAQHSNTISFIQYNGYDSTVNFDWLAIGLVG